jgi:hypothetical protein
MVRRKFRTPRGQHNALSLTPDDVAWIQQRLQELA